jgi:hypothetical protein
MTNTVKKDYVMVHKLKALEISLIYSAWVAEGNSRKERSKSSLLDKLLRLL